MSSIKRKSIYSHPTIMVDDVDILPEENIIKHFRGDYYFLSNFYPIEIKYGDQTYPSVEHAFQAAKAKDLKSKIMISKAKTPVEAKRLGRKVDMVSDWEDIKISVMKDLLLIKFNHPKLLKMLEATKDKYLTEENTWNDTFWGICRGKGLNHLGKLLMMVRSSICENKYTH